MLERGIEVVAERTKTKVASVPAGTPLAVSPLGGAEGLWTRTRRTTAFPTLAATAITECVRRALWAPARSIFANAGEDGSVIVGKLLEKDDANHGFERSRPGCCKLTMIAADAGVVEPPRNGSRYDPIK